MNSIKEKQLIHTELNHQSFPLFILYFLYLEHREKSIPTQLFTTLDEKVKRIANESKSLEELFELFIYQISDISTLENIEDEINYLLIRREHKTHGRIKEHGKQLLKILDTYLCELEEQNHAKLVVSETVTQTENIISSPKKSPNMDTNKGKKALSSRHITLTNSVLDYDEWTHIYESFIWCLDQLLKIPELQEYKAIEKFRNTLSLESRGNTHVFIKVDLFLKHFNVIKFYEYLIGIVEKAPQSSKIQIIDGFKKFVPIFDGDCQNNTQFMEYQKKLQDSLGNNN